MTDVLGQGVYSLTEASNLIGVSRSKLAAWFRCWPKGSGPILKSDYAEANLHNAISFLDLIDASVYCKLRHRVTSHCIRRVIHELGRIWETHHPFGRQEFYTNDDGSRIFIEIAKEEGESSDFIEVLEQQHAMPKILIPFLNKVEYDSTTMLVSMAQLTDDVVIDPKRRYGKPIVSESAMSTKILYDSFMSNNEDADGVADWYGVALQDVRAAIDFETGFPGIAA